RKLASLLKGHACQITAKIKSHDSNGGYACRDFYTRQLDAAGECTALNFGELAIFFKGYAAKIEAILKRAHSNRCHSGRNIYVFQTAFVKRGLADAGYAVRDFNARQRPCHVKRVISDTGYAVWNRYARQGFILRERPLTDGSD